MVSTALAVFKSGELVSWKNEEGFKKHQPNTHKVRYASGLAILAKAKFLDLARSRANEMVVHKYLFDTMTEHKVRPTHIALLSRIALELYWLPVPEHLDMRRAIATDHRTRTLKVEQAYLDELEGLAVDE